MNKHLVVIAGPTAIGKTNLAIRIAKELDTEILSADSRQFYREMSIGTAKPSAEELAVVKHHFIDSHSITEDFTVGDFEVQGLAILEELFKRKDTAVLVGGSGLFINAITEGFDELPKAAPEIRESLNHLYADKGLEALRELLRQSDPVYSQQVDINNPRRIIRALEVSLSTGKPFSSFRKNVKQDRPFKTIKIGLNTDREKLYERINLRVDQMTASGLVDEVKGLVDYQHLNALQTVGYTEIFEFLSGKTLLSEAVDKIKQNTRRFAKRQLTWFRKDKDIRWFEPDDITNIVSYVNEQILTKSHI